MFSFGSFQLDVANASLRRGKQALLLTPKAFNVLRYLVEHAGQLVTKDELWRAVWPGVTVTDAALAVCVGEVRKALRDKTKTPRYIETVHRLGYRFIASVSTQPVRMADSEVRGQEFSPARSPQSHAQHFVGREAELAQLHQWLARALAGERQIIFVTGEPGIGKTTIVEEFLRREQVSREERLWVGRGQCIEHYGTGEAYLPVLDALGRLCREPGGGRLVELLDKHAPTWLVQMPALLVAAQWRELQGRVAGATRARMLGELVEVMEVISHERPLVLRLEDLHWSDYSTLEWLSLLARRQEAARLLVLGTYRPVEVIVREHPLRNLKHELQMHGHCQELLLAPLREATVMEYLAQRFAAPVSSDLSGGRRGSEGPAPEPLQKLAHAIHQRTDGNPLFMINVVDYLVERAGLKTIDAAAAQSLEALRAVRIDAPPSIVQMIELNLEGLTAEEQAVLETASVAGIEFPIAAVATALQRPLGEIETCCTTLSRRQQFVHSEGTVDWPDGTVAARVQFLHGLYRDVLYNRVPYGRRVELHRRVAEREEVGWGERAAEIATELAYHYTQAGQIKQALRYAQLAAEQAQARNAFIEAQESLQQALALLELLPESRERDVRELELRHSLLSMLQMTRGYGASEAVEAAARFRLLAERSGKLRKVFGSMTTRCIQTLIAGDLSTAAALADEALELAQREGNPTAMASLHMMQLAVRYYHGDLAGAENHFAAGLKFVDDPVFRRDPRGGAIAFFGWASFNAWILGQADIARERLAKMRAAVHPANPHDLSWSDQLEAFLHILMREYESAEALAARALELCEKHSFPNDAAYSRCWLGHARAQLGRAADGIALIRQGIDENIKMGNRLAIPFFMTYLAAAQLRAGAVGDALETIERALDFNPEEALARPDTLRIRGELRLEQGNPQLAEADFRDSIAMARNMGAKAWELRTTMSLARLLASQGRRDQARAMLTDIYDWLTEGFDTVDLEEAKALLEELSSAGTRLA
ncbi:MAG: AAA family ATPase [Deltaproteobacteria bacterium]|nr:AAA family ATPase [Deltaproteobacteria bacterium]